MPSNRITISIRGAQSADGAVHLEDFLGELDAARLALIEFDKQSSKTRKRTLWFKIVKLSYASPATVVLEAAPLKGAAGNAAGVISTYMAGIKAVSGGRIPDEMSQDVVQALRRIGKQASRRIAEVEYSSNGEAVSVTRGLDAVIETALGPDEVVHGSIAGMLEMINIHNDLNRFTVYPPAGPTKVECKFAPAQMTEAIQGVGRHVRVIGRLRYKARDKFPYAVDVDGIEVYPRDEELPSFADLRGAAPGITGELSVEEFLDRMRRD
jgi:hypothetical protein